MAVRFFVLLFFEFSLHGVRAQDNLCDVFSEVCLNGGTCVEQGESTFRNVACLCAPEYTGLRCEESLDVLSTRVTPSAAGIHSEGVTLPNDEFLNVLVNSTRITSSDQISIDPGHPTFTSRSSQATEALFNENESSTDSRVSDIIDRAYGQTDKTDNAEIIRESTFLTGSIIEHTTENTASKGNTRSDQTSPSVSRTENYRSETTLLTTKLPLTALGITLESKLSTLKATSAFRNTNELLSTEVTPLNKETATEDNPTFKDSSLPSLPNPIQCIQCTEISASGECRDEDGYVVETCLQDGVCIFVNVTLRTSEVETRQVSSGCINKGIFNVVSGCLPVAEYIRVIGLPYSKETSGGEVCFCNDEHQCNFEPESLKMESLMCFKCENRECLNNDLPTEICDTNEVCISVDIVVTITQDAAFTSVLRGCVEPEDITNSNKCILASEYAPTLSFESTGTVCYCNTTFCNDLPTDTTTSSLLSTTLLTTSDAPPQTISQNTKCFTCESVMDCTETEHLQTCHSDQVCVAVNITLRSDAQTNFSLIFRGCEERLTGERLCLSSREFLKLRPSILPSGFAVVESSGRACFCEEDACNININQEDVENLVLRITSRGLSDKITLEWNTFVQFDGFYVEVKLQGFDSWITISPFLEPDQRMYTIEGIVVADVAEVRVIAIDQSKHEVLKSNSLPVRRIESGKRQVPSGARIPIFFVLGMLASVMFISLFATIWWKTKHRSQNDNVEST